MPPISKRKHYPTTYPFSEGEIPEDEAPQFFEPALKQFPYAFRKGDPIFPDPQTARRWHEARRQVIAHLLRSVSGSGWKNHLVLRGSLLLQAWLGSAAREPGDIDWVFRPKEIKKEDSLAQELFAELIRNASQKPQVGNAVIDTSNIAVDDIWTYERASGRRIVFPWKVPGLPEGRVQIDVVFQETLWTDPVLTLLPAYGENLTLWTVDRESSLAWKLLWLENDFYPQGKDLYDATLLAEQTRLPLELLKRVLQSGEWFRPGELNCDFPLSWHVDWDNFRLEYPWVEGTAMDWQVRLGLALRPMFETG